MKDQVLCPICLAASPCACAYSYDELALYADEIEYDQLEWEEDDEDPVPF